MHDELSDDARSILAQGKHARMPSEARERMRTAVLAQVVVAGGAAAGVAKASAAANSATVGWSLFAKTMFETRLIRNAIARNREGRYEGALRFLRTHAMLHPTGALVDERTATQVEALCGLQRAGEAVAIRDAFVARHPGSPHRARMMQACSAP